MSIRGQREENKALAEGQHREGVGEEELKSESK